MAPIFERRKQKSSLPAFLLIVAILAGAGFLVFHLLYSPLGAPKETTLEMGTESSATVRLGESPNFVEIPNVGELLEGEAVRTVVADGTHLVFFDDSKIYLDANTELELSRVRERDQDESVDIVLSLSSGRVWASVSQKINPRSKVVIAAGDYHLETQGGEFSISTDTVQVASGRANLFVKDSFYETLEVGQEITLSEEDINAIANGAPGPDKKIIAADFQESDWFQKHMNSEVASISLSDEEADGSATDEQSDDNDDADKKDEKETIGGVKILEPGTNETVVETGKNEIAITGTVPSGTQKVVVNGYTLTRFSPGNTTFSYNAATRFGTLKTGANEYTVVAIDKEGNREEAGITIMYDPNKSDADAETSDAKSSPTATPTAAAVSGSVTITAPASGSTVDDETITVSGTVPKNATRVVVDGYALSQYAAGSGTWSYRMADRFGNRPVGKTTIVVRAYDASGALLGSDEVSFTVEKAAASAPVASSPAATPAPAAESREVAPPPESPAEGSSL